MAFWRWLDKRCRDMNDLRSLLTFPDLNRHVVRLRLEMVVSLSEKSEVDRIMDDLRGTDATHGRAGVLVEDRSGLRLRPGSGGAFPVDLPPVLKATVDRLDTLIKQSTEEPEKEKATRALEHLYKLLQARGAKGGHAL